MPTLELPPRRLFTRSTAVTPQRSYLSRCQAPKGWVQILCEHGTLGWFPKRCRVCPGCEHAHRGRIIRRIMAGCESESWVGLLTLTSTPETEWPVIMAKFESMVRWLRSKLPGLQYAAAKEEGSQTGMRHLHVILFPWVWVDFRELSAEWERLTGAWNVNVKRITGPGAITYVAKYVSKAPPELRKAVTFSAAWPKLPKLLGGHIVVDQSNLPPTTVPVRETPCGGLLSKHSSICDCYPETAVPSRNTFLWVRALRKRWRPGGASYDGPL